MPLTDLVQISTEQAADISRVARALGWARILHMPYTAPTVFVLDASAPRTSSVRSYERLESGIAAALGSDDFALAAAEYFDDRQLAEMHEL